MTTKHRVAVNVIDHADGKVKQLHISKTGWDAINAEIERRRQFRLKWLVVHGPLYPERIKGRSKRGWTTPKAT